MPRFYFLRINGCLLIDDQGINLACPTSARERGVVLAASDLIRLHDAAGIALGRTLLVTDDEQQVLGTYALPF